MPSSTILSDNGVSSGTSGIKTSGGNDGLLLLQTTTAGGTATTAVTVDTSQNVGIGTSSLPGYRVSVKQSGNTSLASIGIASINSANDTYIGMGYHATSDTCRILASYDTNGAFKPITFLTSDAERMRIDSSGNLLVGTTAVNNTNGFSIAPSTAPYVTLNKSATGTKDAFYFEYNGAIVGKITYSDTATAYNTSSDYRLKHDIQPMSGALAKVAALKPVTYKWNADDSAGEGFIAHELAEVVPQCVTGEKDAVDADGSPQYQGIDTSFLVATLTAAIQEQQKMIETLRVEVAELKAKV